MFRSVGFAVAVVGAWGSPMRKVSFSSGIVESYGAKCLDGSGAGYYIREVPGSQDWVFLLEGGGLCISIADCQSRVKKGDHASSKHWPDTIDDHTNVLNDEFEGNQFAGFNAVFFPYCSGDTWMGTSKRSNLELGGLYTSGHLILEAGLDSIFSTVISVNRVLLAGFSAGGIGVFHSADWFRETITQKFGYSDAIVKASAQSGLFFPSTKESSVGVYQAWEIAGENAIRVDILASWWINFHEHPFYQKNCKADGESAARCWDSGIVANYVDTPMFIAQNRYDCNQMNGVMLFGYDCQADASTIDDKHRGYMNYFGNHTETALRALERDKGHSVFMPNCFKHVEDMCITTGGPVIDELQYADALSDWFFNDAHYGLYATGDANDAIASSTCVCPNTQPNSRNSGAVMVI